MRHRLPAALVLALLTVGISGCSDEEKPDVADPTTSTPTSAEPTSDPPTSDATPKGEPESAKEFIRRWFDVADAMQTTGDTADYVALAAPDCKPCLDTADLISGYYKAGGSVTFGGTTIKRVQSIGTIGDLSEFKVQVISAPTKYRERAGGPIKSFDGGPSEVYLKLERTETGWLVSTHGIYSQ